MPRLDVPLSGWSQEADERGGAPRVARLTNCALSAPGRISKTPGQAAISGTADVTTISQSLAFGDNWQIFKDPSSTAAPGFRFARANNGSWVYLARDWDYASPCEAPRLRQIFTAADAHFLHPGVMDLGNGTYVVYAERCEGFSASGTTLSFGAHTVEWALVSALDDMRVIKRGSIDATGAGGGLAYPCHDATYLAFRIQAYCYVYVWSPSTLTFSALPRFAFAASTTGLYWQFGFAYGAVTNELFVVSSDGGVSKVNATTGAVLSEFENSITDIVPSVAGMVAVTRQVTTPTGYTVAGNLFWICWQVGNQWWYEARDYVISATPSDPGYNALISDGTLWTSIGVEPDPVILNAAPSPWNRRAEFCEAAAPKRMWAVAPYSDAAWTAYPLTGWAYTVTELDPANARYRTQTLTARRMAATNPVWDAANGAVFWSYDATAYKAVRTADFVGQVTPTVANTRSDYYGPRSRALIGGDPGPHPDPAHFGISGKMVRSDYLGPKRAGVYRKGWIAALQVQRPSTTNCDVYLSTVVDGFAYASAPTANLPDVLQMASARGQVMIASGVPTSWTTEPDFGGWTAQPDAVAMVATGDSGTWDGTETVTLCIATKYVDQVGKVHWSPLSDIRTLTPTAGSSPHFVFPADKVDRGWSRYRVHLFRSFSGVFYDVSGDGYVNGSYDTHLSPASVLGTSYEANPILYTQGANGALSGQLEHFGCPPCRTIWAGRNRMIAGGLANERRVQVSNLFFPTEGISWPQNAAFFIEVDEPVTAVAALDDWWLVFSEHAIWVVTGEGPDVLGTGTFDEPLRISSGLGCPSWRSLVETPKGLMFQGSDGQIYLIAPGSRSPQLVSGPVRDTIAASLSYDPGDPEVWVQGAAFDPMTQEVWFQTSAGDWVFSLATMSWRRESLSSSGVTWPMGANTAALADASYKGPVLVRLSKAYRPRRRTEANAFTSAWAGTYRNLEIETSDVSLGEAGRIRRGWFRVARDYFSKSLVPRMLKVSIWYDGADRSTSGTDSRLTESSTTQGVSSFFDVDWAPARQKCSAFRVRFAEENDDDLNDGFHVLSVVFDVESTRGTPIRYPSGSARMT